MSRVLEALHTAPSEIYAQSAGHLMPVKENGMTPEVNCFFTPGIRMLEGQILSLQSQMELTGTMLELRRFQGMERSNNKVERDLFTGTSEKSGDKKIIMVNGFVPYNVATENPLVAPIYEFWQKVFPPLKSNTILEPKRQWYKRHGHDAEFAFDRPNHIWFQNFKDTYNTTIDAISESSTGGKDVWLDGLSAGGMLGEMVLKKLAKKGIAVNLISNGSPEVNESILELFDNSTSRPGLMGRVHKSALLSAEMDLDYARMREEIEEAALGDFHPDSMVLRFYSNNDNVVPSPQDSNAIEVGGPHTAIPYRRIVLETEANLLANNQKSLSEVA